MNHCTATEEAKFRLFLACPTKLKLSYLPSIKMSTVAGTRTSALLPARPREVPLISLQPSFGEPTRHPAPQHRRRESVACLSTLAPRTRPGKMDRASAEGRAPSPRPTASTGRWPEAKRPPFGPRLHDESWSCQDNCSHGWQVSLHLCVLALARARVRGRCGCRARSRGGHIPGRQLGWPRPAHAGCPRAEAEAGVRSSLARPDRCAWAREGEGREAGHAAGSSPAPQLLLQPAPRGARQHGLASARTHVIVLNILLMGSTSGSTSPRRDQRHRTGRDSPHQCGNEGSEQSPRAGRAPGASSGGRRTGIDPGPLFTLGSAVRNHQGLPRHSADVTGQASASPGQPPDVMGDEVRSS